MTVHAGVPGGEYRYIGVATHPVLGSAKRKGKVHRPTRAIKGPRTRRNRVRYRTECGFYVEQALPVYTNAVGEDWCRHCWPNR